MFNLGIQFQKVDKSGPGMQRKNSDNNEKKQICRDEETKRERERIIGHYFEEFHLSQKRRRREKNLWQAT